MKSIAVIIPVFMQSHHLAQALHSVANQLRLVDQVIVVDDNSPMLPSGADDSIEIRRTVGWFNSSGVLAAEMDPIILMENQANKGVAYSRNSAAAFHHDCEWLKFLDADDVLAPFALETFRREKIEEDMHVVSGSLVQVVNGKVGGTIAPNFGNILYANPSLVSNTFIRRTAFVDSGGFDERLQFEEDWELWLKLEAKFGINAFGVMDYPVCYYWISDIERAQKVRDNTITVPDFTRQPALKDSGTLSQLIAQLPTKRIDVREYFRNKYKIKS